MNSLEKLQSFNQKRKLCVKEFLSSTYLGQLTLRDEWTEKFSNNHGPELYHAYLALCDVAGVTKDKRPRLIFSTVNQGTFGEYAPSDNTISVFDYSYALITMSGLVSMVAHELGHFVYQDKMASFKKKSTDTEAYNFIQQQTNWSATRIDHEAEKIIKQQSHLHSVREITETFTYEQQVRKYRKAYRTMAGCIVDAMDEMLADAFAQSMLGSEWAGQFMKEVAVLEKKRLPGFLWTDSKKTEWNCSAEIKDYWFLEDSHLPVKQRLHLIKNPVPIEPERNIDTNFWRNRIKALNDMNHGVTEKISKHTKALIR